MNVLLYMNNTGTPYIVLEMKIWVRGPMVIVFTAYG